MHGGRVLNTDAVLGSKKVVAHNTITLPWQYSVVGCYIPESLVWSSFPQRQILVSLLNGLCRHWQISFSTAPGPEAQLSSDEIRAQCCMKVWHGFIFSFLLSFDVISYTTAARRGPYGQQIQDEFVRISSGSYDIKTRVAVKMEDENNRGELFQNLINKSHAFMLWIYLKLSGAIAPTQISTITF